MAKPSGTVRRAEAASSGGNANDAGTGWIVIDSGVDVTAFGVSSLFALEGRCVGGKTVASGFAGAQAESPIVRTRLIKINRRFVFSVFIPILSYFLSKKSSFSTITKKSPNIIQRQM
jgi:hypothetical protein